MTGVLHFVLITLGCIAPWLIELIRCLGINASYSYLQITNVFWSLSEIDKVVVRTDRITLVGVVLFLATLAVAVNLPAVIRELRQVRIEPPPRLLEEDAALAAEKSPPKPVHTNPWN